MLIGEDEIEFGPEFRVVKDGAGPVFADCTQRFPRIVVVGVIALRRCEDIREDFNEKHCREAIID